MNWILYIKHTNNKKMSLSEQTPLTGWEKWINRIVTIAVAIYSALQSLGIIHLN